jgi:hypothetical protein
MRSLLMLLGAGCVGGDPGDSGTLPETGGDTDTGAGTHTGADTDTAADPDTGAATDTGGDWPADVDLRVCADGSVDFTDIQDAIDVSTPGDVIGVCPGAYGPIEVLWTFDVDVRGLEGPEVTRIDGGGLPAVHVREGTLALSGFTVTGDGYDDPWFPMAGGLTVWDGIGTFRDLVVEDCTGPFTLLFDEDWLVMDDIVWRDNTSTFLWYLWQGEDDPYGAGPPPPGSAVITDNVVLGGVHQTVIETTKLEVLELTNNVFAQITIDGGFTAFMFRPWNGGPLTVANNVFYDIDDTLPWGGRMFDGQADFRNNIVAGCDAYDLLPMSSDYSLFWDNGSADYASAVIGTGNLIGLDPLFVDPSTSDYHLQAGSPAIDAGDPSPAYADPDGTRNDMGAHGGPAN